MAEESKETDEARAQREMIEAMKRKQQEALQQAAQEAASKIEESKEEEPTDATKIKVEDNFDIDDI